MAAFAGDCRVFGLGLHFPHIVVAFQTGFMAGILGGGGGDFLQGIPPEPAVLTEGGWYQEMVGHKICDHNGHCQPGQPCQLRWKESFHGILFSLRSSFTSIDNDIYLLHTAASCKDKRQTYPFIFQCRSGARKSGLDEAWFGVESHAGKTPEESIRLPYPGIMAGWLPTMQLGLRPSILGA